MSLRSLRVLLVTAAAVGGLGLAGAAFADDDGPAPIYGPPILPPVQVDLQGIQAPLQDLVWLSVPGAVVTTSLVPEDKPAQVMVTISDPSGEMATDATLDPAFIRSLVIAAPAGEQREALTDALKLTADDHMTMRDLNPTPITMPAS